MANKILIQEIDGTPPQITFADFAGDFSPAAAVDLRHATAVDIQVQIILASLADAAARQSDKVDLGEHRAAAYKVRAAFELAATPNPGDVISLYWAPSQHATAANGNAGGVSGSDAAYTGDNSNMGDAVKQLDFIGNFVCTNLTTTGIQRAEVGILIAAERYGSLVVRNESAAAFHTDDVESHVVFDPIIDELQ